MKPQQRLFDDQEPWEEEWVGMPEYIQKDKGAVHRIMVNFETEEDMLRFSDLVGHKIGYKTKAIFYPPTKTEKKIYIDES